jgi:methylthioribose-1-phosphate isomerase
MKISGTHYRTIWPTATGSVRVIDQSRLPFEFSTVDLNTLDDARLVTALITERGERPASRAALQTLHPDRV